jgi:hypothetical protein
MSRQRREAVIDFRTKEREGMKTSFVMTTVVFLLAGSATVHAQDPAPPGKIDFALKLGYVVFSKGVTEDDGIYLGLAGYRKVAANIYLGAEATAASTITLFTDEMSLAPLELNVMYARAVGSNFLLAGGAGLSYARAKFHEEHVLVPDVTYHEWLFGGQAFGDFVCRIKWFALGVNLKYQLLQDFEQVPADFSNFRLGLQAGVIF